MKRSKRTTAGPAQTAEHPLDTATRPAWRYATSGWRRSIVIALFVFGGVLTWLATTVESGQKLSAFVASFFPASREMDVHELDVCNSWLARVSEFESKHAAESEAVVLQRVLAQYSDWRGEVHPVRNPASHGLYLVVLDIEKGASTESAVIAWLDKTRRENAIRAGDQVGNALRASTPMYYSASEFEGTFGRQSQQCHHRDLRRAGSDRG